MEMRGVMLKILHPLYQEDLYNAAVLIGESGLTGKVLIIGATGLIGSFLTDVLSFYNRNIERRFEIHAIGRDLKRLNTRFSYLDPAEIHLWEHDIVHLLETEVEYDYIFHLASNADPGGYAAYPVETIITNVQGTVNVLEYAKKHPHVRILFTSSMEVYGENDGEALQESDYGLIDFNGIRAGYPESKRVSELLYKSALQEYGIQTCIARLGYIYGPTMTDSDNKVVAQFIRAAANGQDLVLKSCGEQRRTYCYVADAVTGIVKVLMEGEAGEAYNVADRNSLVTIRQLGEMIANEAKAQLVFDFEAEEEVASIKGRDVVLDSGKLELLGWGAKVGIREGIGRSLELLVG